MPKAVEIDQYRNSLANIAIIAPLKEPNTEIEGLAHNKIDGMAMGAGKTFASCADPMIGGFNSECTGSTEFDAICRGVIITWLGFCGVSSVVGGVFGAAKAPNETEIYRAELSLAKIFNSKRYQGLLKEQIITTAHSYGRNFTSISPEIERVVKESGDYRLLAKEGVETVIEVTLTKLNTVGNDIAFDSPLQLQMETRVRLILASDNSEIFSTNYIYRGKKLKLSEWLANLEELLVPAIKTGYESLASHIYESIFMLYPLPDRKPQIKGLNSFGLAPIYPKMSMKVKDRRPELSWQSFPREGDVEPPQEVLSKIMDVKYDLVIARSRNGTPDKIVYYKEGLGANTHKLESLLLPGTEYFWSIRARFELDGDQRITEWATVNNRYVDMTTPSQWSYLFRTPDN